MRTAKQQFIKDIPCFLDDRIFAERHYLNGIETAVVFETDTTLSDANKFAGMWTISKILYVKTSFFEILPVPNSIFKLDEEIYYVISCEDQQGITKIVLRGDDS